MAVDDLLQVGADMVGINLRRRGLRARGDVGGLEDQDGRALEQGDALAGQDADHAAALGGGDDMLHLHRLQHRDGLPWTDQIALGDLDRAHRGLQRRGDGDRTVLGIGRDFSLFRRPGRIRGGLAGLPRSPRRLSLNPAGLFQQVGEVCLKELRGRRARGHDRLGEHHTEQVGVAVDPLEPELRQGAGRAGAGLFQGGAAHDHLGQQAVVGGAGDVTGVARAVDPHPRPAGRLVGGDQTPAGQGAAIGRQGLQVDPRLHREALRGGGLRQADLGQGLAGGQLDLDPDQVKAGDLLGDRMFDLQPGVGLDEGEAALAVDQELDGRQGPVLGRRAQLLGRLVQGLAQGVGQGRRGDLDQLLVAPLDRAVAVAGRHHGPAVGDDLDLDVAGVLDQPLGVDGSVPERGQGLAGTGRQRELDLGLGADQPHAAPAAARHGLEHHRTVLLEEGPGAGQVDWPRPGQHRHLGLGGHGAGLRLVPKGFQRVRRGTDEGDLRRRAGPGEGGVLGQEAVAGMDRVAPGRPRRRDHAVDVEIGFRPRAVQRHGLVGGRDMGRRRVVLRMDRHARDPQVGRRPGDADGDLAPVGDEDALEGHDGPIPEVIQSFEAATLAAFAGPP